LFRPALFGLSDGMMSILGSVLYLLHHPSWIVPVALLSGLANALSMGGGEFLSDNDTGFWGAFVMGIATGSGAVLPAIPFMFGHGPLAIGIMVAVCLCIGVIVGGMRKQNCMKHSLAYEITTTLALLALIFGAVAGLSLVIPAGGVG
jgi:VIT1/CCC1 family predicted Fe2+/Mn2+ transporter